jgi:hypothetical protein
VPTGYIIGTEAGHPPITDTYVAGNVFLEGNDKIGSDGVAASGWGISINNSSGPGVIVTLNIVAHTISSQPAFNQYGIPINAPTDSIEVSYNICVDLQGVPDGGIILDNGTTIASAVAWALRHSVTSHVFGGSFFHIYGRCRTRYGRCRTRPSLSIPGIYGTRTSARLCISHHEPLIKRDISLSDQNQVDTHSLSAPGSFTPEVLVAYFDSTSGLFRPVPNGKSVPAVCKTKAQTAAFIRARVAKGLRSTPMKRFMGCAAGAF